MKRITTSEVTTYLRCREEHRLRYGLQLRSSEPPSKALAIGTAIHKGLEVWWSEGDHVLPQALRAAQEIGTANGLDVYDQVRVEVMLEAYDRRWHRDRDEYISRGLEVVFDRPQKGWTLSGRFDGLIEQRHPRQLLVLEHKTTSDDLGPHAPYWDGLAMDWQIVNYLRASQAEGVLYDVLKKPGIFPLKATPVEKRRWKQDGTLFANQRAEDETIESWRGRLREGYADGSVWFERRVLRRTQGEVARAISEMDQLASEILAVEVDRPAPRTPGSCQRYGRQCDYYRACTGQAQLAELPLYQATTPHEELL